MEKIHSSHITQDACLVSLGEHPVPHPTFSSIEAFEAKIDCPLSNIERNILATSTNICCDIFACLRSAYCQLGIDLFPHEIAFSDIHITSQCASITLHLSDLNQKKDSSVIQALRAALRQGVSPKIARLGIFPTSSLLDRRQLAIAKKEGCINFDRLYESNSIIFPISHFYEKITIDPENLCKMTMTECSTREIISSLRRQIREVFVKLEGNFFIAGTDITIPDHHVLLDGTVLDGNGEITPLQHLAARLLEAGRTRGRRQLEFSCPDQYSLPSKLYVVARAYNPCRSCSEDEG